MNRFVGILSVILTVMLPIAPVAETTGDIQPRLEKSGEPGMAGRYFKTMLSNAGLLPKPKPVKVEFTRAWIDSQPVASGDEQWQCLSEALYFEARGETVKGQFAVAEVILNRVRSSRFPDTPCAVINQGTGRKFQCQFTYTCDGVKNRISEKQAYERVAKVARASLDGAEGVGGLTGGATHYHTIAVRPAWARTYTKTARIGVHLFYRHNYRTAQNN